MPELPDDLAGRVADAARRLKMVHVGFADEPARARQQYMSEVVEQSLQAVPPDLRPAFLLELKTRFAVWDEAGGFGVAEAPKVEETPEQLVDRLVAMAPLMGDVQKQDAASRLQACGLLATPMPEDLSADEIGGGDDLVLPQRLKDIIRYIMRNAGIKKLDLARSMKLILLLIIYIGNADDLIWKAWKTIAPRSPVRRPCELRKLILRYVSGDKEVQGTEVKEQIEHLQRLSAAIIAAVGQSGANLARAHLSKFSPNEIAAKVGLEGGNVLASQEFKCWNRYQKMARDLEEDVIEHAIREAISKYTEALMSKTK